MRRCMVDYQDVAPRQAEATKISRRETRGLGVIRQFRISAAKISQTCDRRWPNIELVFIRFVTEAFGGSRCWELLSGVAPG